VTEYSVDTVLAELARCIALFPNLHTVQLHFRFNRFKFLDTFKTYQYPSIKNVYICPMSAMFLCACPEVRVVSPVKWYIASWWPRFTFEIPSFQCPALEVLGPFAFDKGDAKSEAYFLSQTVLTLTLFFLAIARKWPKLREIFLHAATLRSGFVCIVSHAVVNETEVFLLQEYVSGLSKLRHLHIINIIAIRHFVPNQKVTEWLQWANETFFQYPQNLEDNQGPRRVVLYYEGRDPETFNF